MSTSCIDHQHIIIIYIISLPNSSHPYLHASSSLILVLIAHCPSIRWIRQGPACAETRWYSMFDLEPPGLVSL